MAEWAGILNTTTRRFLKEVENNVMRNRKLLALMRQKGRVKMNAAGGTEDEWRVLWKRHNMVGMADAQTLSFPRSDRHKIARLGWRGYASTDSMTVKERLINSGVQAIVNRYSDVTKSMLDDMQENFGDELYIDGNASGNELRIHGIESFMGTTGSAIVGTPVMAPSDTYAELVTTLGNYGGTWNGTWPKSTGSPEYDFWAPLILDITSSLAAASGGWTSSTATWFARCLEIVRFGIIHSKKNKSMDGMNDLITMDAEFYRLFLEQLATKEDINIERGVRRDGLLAMGYTDVVSYDGVEITFEFGMPQNTVYGWNMANMELLCLRDQMFHPTGPEFNMAAQAWLFCVDFYGNLHFNPRYFWKAAAYGTNGA